MKLTPKWINENEIYGVPLTSLYLTIKYSLVKEFNKIGNSDTNLPLCLILKKWPAVNWHWNWHLGFPWGILGDVCSKLGGEAPAIGLHSAIIFLYMCSHLFVLLPTLLFSLFLGLLRFSVINLDHC